MDKTAIETIQQTAIDAHARRIPTALQDRLTAIPSDYRLHDLEEYESARRRFRGRLVTESLADFVAYVKQHHGEGFIDADKLAATVFFNLGDKVNPGHGDWRATLALKATAPFKAMQAIAGKAIDQRTLVDFLEDWKANLVPISQDDAYMSASAAITAVRQITIAAKREAETTEGNFNAARSTLEEVEARSRTELPKGFTFTCVPYLGLPSREFFLRLSILTSSEKPQLVLRIATFEAEQEAIAQDFKRVLIEEIGEAANLTIGTFTP